MRLTKRSAIGMLIMTALVLSMTVLTAKAETAGSGSTSLQSISLFPASCDSNGDKKDVFQLDENVYVKGGYFILVKYNALVDIYVVVDGVKLGQSIPSESIVSGPVNAQLAGRSLPIVKIWNAPLKKGHYDVWVDVDRDGKLDLRDGYFYLGIGLIGDSSYEVSCGCTFDTHLFTVVPETYIGSIGALAAMIGAFALFGLKKTPKISKKAIK